MATQTIAGYTAAASIDAVNDFLLIEPSGNTVYKKINRNVLLGITGNPLGTTDTQTITNKILGITNTFTVLDSTFTIQDNVDNTKQAQFQLSAITTGTTRTYTMPNASVTLASLTGTETLTNKTITSPAITGGTIDNATVTVDAISGHTSATVVTIANLQISSGVLNSNNSVVTANITDGNITPAKLQSGTGSGWAWTTYSPSLTNLTQGNGTLSARYIQIGKTVFVRIKFTLGNTSAVGTVPSLTLPVTPNAAYSSQDLVVGWGLCVAGGTQAEIPVLITSTTASPYLLSAASTYLGPTANITSTTPGTWTTSDFFHIQFVYEAA